MKHVKEFLTKGYTIVKFSKNEKSKLDQIKKKLISPLKVKYNLRAKNFYENFHNVIDVHNLNEIRINLYKKINQKKFNIKYYNLCSNFIEPLVGIENVIQKNINLSIQLPNDNSSLLPIHSDTWAGDSPYEIVVWIPLVDCKKTQSMFILPKNSKRFEKFNKRNFKLESEIMNFIKKDIKFINIKYGQALIFSQNLPHGNVVNREKNTRWSLNARVKSLLSPYSSKSLLDFFDVVKILPATEFGLNYEYPKFK
tara:strand:- start:531 stop:1289 length:759 start_codon:yes stop_codon:yes gene_type:complete